MSTTINKIRDKFDANKYIEILKTIAKNRVFIFLVIFCLIIVAIIASIKSTNPGDMFYSLNRALFYKVAESSENKLESYEQNLIRDYQSYNYLLNQNNCIQVLIAEEQIVFDAKGFVETAKATSAENFKDNNLLKDFQNNISNNLNTENTSCKFQQSIAHLDKIIYISTLKFKDEEYKIKLLNEMFKKSQNSYNLLSQTFKEKIFDSQQAIESTTGILVVSKDINMQVVELVNSKNFDQAYSLLVFNEFILDFAKESLENSEVNNNIVKSYITTICKLSNSDNCANEVVDSKWNSIVNRDSTQEIYDLASKLFVQYLSLNI